MLATPLTPHRGQRRYSSVSSGGENNSTTGGPGRFNLAERGLSAVQSPRNPKGLSHCIFECLIVEASSQAQNHLSVLADRYTERCRGVFDCPRDGQCDNLGSGSTRWPGHFAMGSGPLLPKSGVV